MKKIQDLRSYRELIKIEGFFNRFEYLRLDGSVGELTFGWKRYMNQVFYTSYEWRNLRNYIIARDSGCDLAVPDRLICGTVYIHHINPLTEVMIKNEDPLIFDPDNLISASYDTHQAIHYGSADILIPDEPVIRLPGDTKLW